MTAEADGAVGARRKWRKLGAKWQSSFPLDTSNVSLGSWLDEQDEPWGIGCKACRSAGCTGNLAQYLVTSEAGIQKENFMKHAKSKNHCNAVAHYLSVAVSATAGSLPSSDLAIDAAPSPDQFKDCLEKMKKGVALEGRKLTMMVYCLAEAMKPIDQRHLSRAAEIALFRDERKGRILLRFRAVTNNLEIWSGMLGQERDAGTGGLNLTKATESILKRACGRWFGSGSDKQKPFVKWQLFNQVRQKITTITVDSAQDELVSGEIMRTALTPQQQVLCPNLRCVIRDKAHSSRRLTSRPWNADDALKETMNFFCGGPGSVARLIQYSPEIRRVFEKICEESDNAVRSAVVNFRSAQHRFESHSKTLGRTCLFLHACIRTCLHLVRTRKDAVGNKAKLWIQKLDAETALMAAMLADAADSSLQLTRKMDSEEVDPACMTLDVAIYLEEIRALFIHEEVLRRFGYTSTMLQTLQQPLVFQAGSLTKCLGSESGVSKEIQERCLSRMKIWVRLATEALKAEFPSFELGQAYRVFNLHTGSLEATSDLARIAQVCKLDAQVLQHQWSDLYPRARANMPSDLTANANRQAWQRTLQQMAESRTGHCHPSGVLRSALVSYFVYGGSSSGVEQAFSRNSWVCNARRAAMRPHVEEMVLKVSSGVEKYDLADLLRLAQLTWQSCFGRPRESSGRVSRLDKGLKRTLTGEDGLQTEAAFTRKRRKEAAAASSACRHLEMKEEEEDHLADSALWSEKHDRELAFQKRKAFTKLVHAFSENALLPAECPDDLQEAHLQCMEKMRTNEVKRQQRRLCADAIDKGCSKKDFFGSIQGCVAYLAVSATGDLKAACQLSSVQITQNPADAGIIVCNDPGQMTDVKLQLVSALSGCYEVSPGLMLGSKGCALKMHTAAAIPRALLVSPGSRKQDADFWTFLRKALPLGHAWVLHSVDLGNLREQQGRFKPGVAFIMVTVDEAKDKIFSGAKNVYTIHSFLARIRRVDALKSVNGLSTAP